MSSHLNFISVRKTLSHFGHFKYRYIIYIQPIFKNQPNGSCSHLSENASKGRLFGPYKLQQNTKEGKRKEKREREGRKEEKRKKAMLALLVFIMATLKIVFARKKNCLTQKVRLAVTFSKISTFFISSHFLYLKQNSLEQLRVTIRKSRSSSSRR